MNTNNNVNTTNILTLSKCAYIYHWSNSNYTYGNSDYRARKAAINKVLKSVYDVPAKGVNIPYTIEHGRAFIELDGVKIDINDRMLQNVFGEYPHAEIVNGLTFRDLKPFYNSFMDGTFTALQEYSYGQQSFWGKKLKSLEIETFPSVDSLRYYRLHFKGNSMDIIVSNGKVYDAGNSNYTNVSKDTILSRLDAISKVARDIITKFVEYITKD